jgi:hypothetical protein
MASRLKQLNWVAVWIFNLNPFAARATSVSFLNGELPLSGQRCAQTDFAPKEAHGSTRRVPVDPIGHWSGIVPMIQGVLEGRFIHDSCKRQRYESMAHLADLRKLSCNVNHGQPSFVAVRSTQMHRQLYKNLRIISNVGHTRPPRKCPPCAVPSALPTTTCTCSLGLPSCGTILPEKESTSTC